MSKEGIDESESSVIASGANNASKIESDDKVAASSLLAQGKRHLFVKDYPSAVTTLGEACGKFSEIYGELAYECADAYFNYGCALLELAREESGVLQVDDREKGSEEESEESCNNDETVNENEDTVETEKNAVGEEKEKEEGGEEEEEEEEDDDTVNNLQLAWEIFELARRSFDQKKDELKLAETYLKLGEVALESENYDGAITDLQQCLDLQKRILPAASREVAETYFQLGIACSLSNQFDEAIKNFSMASQLLENRIQILSTNSEPEPDKAKNPFYSVANEIQEIKTLLPEIKIKILDMEDFKKETMKVVHATIGNSIVEPTDGAGPSCNGTASASAPVKSSLPPANDISHLVRKKRKLDDTNESEEAKKQ